MYMYKKKRSQLAIFLLAKIVLSPFTNLVKEYAN